MNCAHRTIENRFSFRLVLTVAFALAACSAPDFETEKPVAFAMPAPKNSELQDVAQSLQLSGTELDYIIPLDTGNQALGARLHLIESAERSLDLQYFLMKPDFSSALLARELLNAADRGIRVRLLLDDVFTTVEDADLYILDRHPNIFVRVFNPAARPGPKWASFAGDFQRMNRRMHNKAFVADNTFAILGGRNLADEYFEVDPSKEFADFEIVFSGPTVEEISSGFDQFWNDKWSVPLTVLRTPPSEENLQQRLAELSANERQGRVVYERAINDPLFDDLEQGNGVVWTSKAEFVTDSPSKLKTPVHRSQFKLAEELYSDIANAKESVVLLTPYFVPEDYGARIFSDLAEKGVDVRIVTNSIGSTNHVYTHAGYRRHRPGLLASGVSLNEVRPDALSYVAVGDKDEKLSLVMHTKLVVIDKKMLFVGSMNFDPRSVKLNSESGVFIYSPAMARDAVGVLDRDIENFTYQLQLNEEGEIGWVFKGSQPNTVTFREPDATAWRRFVVGVTELLSIELQL